MELTSLLVVGHTRSSNEQSRLPWRIFFSMLTLHVPDSVVSISSSAFSRYLLMKVSSVCSLSNRVIIMVILVVSLTLSGGIIVTTSDMSTLELLTNQKTGFDSTRVFVTPAFVDEKIVLTLCHGSSGNLIVVVVTWGLDVVCVVVVGQLFLSSTSLPSGHMYNLFSTVFSVVPQMHPPTSVKATNRVRRRMIFIRGSGGI